MSTLETTPIINTTSTTVHQNQTIESKQALPIEFASIVDPMLDLKISIPTQMINIPSIANMEKYISSFNWSLAQTSGTEIYSYPVTIQTIMNLSTFGRNRQAFVNMKSLSLFFRNTNNFAYQGSLILSYVPEPIQNFHHRLFNRALGVNETFQLMNRRILEPKNRDPIEINIPIDIPFELFHYLTSVSGVEDYVRLYQIGTVRVIVNVPLETKSPTTSLNFRVSGLINQLQTAGNVF